MRHAPLPIDCSDTACPLYGRRDCVPAELACHHEDEVCDLLFIGEAPGKTEVDKRRPFVGESGRLLRKAIKEASPGPVNVAYSNVARCLPLNEAGDIRKPVAAEVKACQHFLMADIERLDPDVICLLGASAIELFLPDRPTVHAERGRWRRVNIAGRDRIVMTTWHPAYVLRQFSALPMWFTDLQLCLRMGAGWRPRPEWGAVGQSRCLKTVEEVADLVETMLSLDRSHYVALDVETRNLNKRYGNRLGMLQFSWDGTSAHCVPLDHPQTPFDDAGLRAVRKLMRRLFTRKPQFRGWLTHFGKFEQTQIGQHVLDRGDGVARTFSNAPMLDTGAFAYLLNENATAAKGAAYTLKFLARQYLGFFHYDDTTLVARAGGQLLDLPLDCAVPIGQEGWEPNLTDYGGMDAYVTWRLFWALQEEAAVQRYRGKALTLLKHLFGPTFTLLSQIERNGFWGNLAHLKMLQDPERSPIVSRLLEIDEQVLPAIPSAQRANDKLVLTKSHGSPPLFDTPWILDLNKDAHVRAWLVDELELEPLEKGKTGVASVAKAFFQHYSDVDEVKLVEERRGLAKLQSAYIKQLIEYIDPRYATEDCQDGRVRCDLFFTTTVSGRGSASNPNMQQQVRGDSPAKAAIKNIWQAEQPGVQRSFRVDFTKGPPDLSARALERVPTNCLVQLDFVTAEVKWWALLSKCPALAKALLRGYKMRQEYRANPRPALKEKASIEGDLHKNTAALMFGVPVSQVDKAMRTGAKCLVGSTYCFTSDGIKRLDELPGSVPERIHAGDGVGHVTAAAQTKVIDETTVVTTEHGLHVEGTGDHRVQVLRRDLSFAWKRLDALTSDDYLIVPTQNDVWAERAPALPFRYEDYWHGRDGREKHFGSLIRTKTPSRMTEPLARLLGYLVAEGYIREDVASFSNRNLEVLEDFEQCYVAAFGGDRGLRAVKTDDRTGVAGYAIGKYVTTFLIEVVGLREERCGGQEVPWSIMQSPRPYVIEFLRGFFEGDGSASVRDNQEIVRTASASGELIRQLQLLLLNLGIVSRRSSELRTLPVKRHRHLYHTLAVRGQHATRFAEMVGFISGDKQGRRAVANDRQRGHYGEAVPYAKEAVNRNGWVGEWTRAKQLTYRYLQRNDVVGRLRVRGDDELADRLAFLMDHRFVFSQVRSVERHFKYQTPVYDVTVETSHRFVANGVTAHNSIVFGALYGRGVKALAAQIKKDEDEAQALLDKFSGAFPVGWDWLQRCPIIAGEKWYIESPIGRRRRLPSYLLWSHNMNWDERRVVSECDRMAKNSPIQGISSDASFLGAALFAQYIEQHGLSWRVQNVVHDSCVYQVPIAELRESIAVAERCFTTDTMQVLTDVWGMRFTCPIEIDFEFGLAWGGLTKWDFTDAEFERLRGEMLCQIV